MGEITKRIFKEELYLMDFKIIKTKNFRDNRGYFYESYNKKNNININYVQDNISFSKSKGTLRGLHLQQEPFSQSKLIRVIKGKIQDVIVDVRPDSKYFGKHKSFIISERNKNLLFVPNGYAHGFCSLEDNTIVHYKVSNYYNPKSEITIKWNDKDLNIKWMINHHKISISKKDKLGISFQQFQNKII